MFGSQALEVAIGLALVFFVLALASSAVTEIYSQLSHKRATDLKKAIGRLVSGETELPEFVTSLYATSPIASLVSAARRDPSYVSAAAFAEGVVEYLRDGEGELTARIDSLPPALQSRVQDVVNNVGADIAAIRAELEGWFDNAMERVTGLYKRWARWFVLGTTVAIVLIANVDTVQVTQSLWETPALREAVVEAAADVGDPAGATPSNIEDVAEDVSALGELGIPMGWECPDAGCGGLSDWIDRVTDEAPARVLGWVLTILLVSLGAPFWYALLTQLFSLRSSGSKPQVAGKDSGSMTSLLAGAETISIAPGPSLPDLVTGEVQTRAAEAAAAQVVAAGAADDQEAIAIGAAVNESVRAALTEAPEVTAWETALVEALTQTVSRSTPAS